MPLFRREPKAPPALDAPLQSGEEVERSTRATLLYGKEAKKGALHMTNRRLLFEAEKGDARWMVVPYDEMTSAGLFPWPRATMGTPSSRQQCLVVETTAGEQVWWDFGEKEEREWLPLVRERIASPDADGEDEGDDW